MGAKVMVVMIYDDERMAKGAYGDGPTLLRNLLDATSLGCPAIDGDDIRIRVLFIRFNLFQPLT
jgi:hypothetical protein